MSIEQMRKKHFQIVDSVTKLNMSPLARVGIGSQVSAIVSDLILLNYMMLQKLEELENGQK